MRTSLFFLIFCVCVSAQSPQDRLLARRAAGIDGYRNLAVELEKFFSGLYPGASTEYFQDLQIRGAKRNHFQYNTEGCVVEMELPVEYILETLNAAASSSGVTFTQTHADKVNLVFKDGLKVSGFGKYRGKAGTPPIQPTPKKNPIKINPPSVEEEKEEVKNFEINPNPKKTPLPPKEFKEMEEELDHFLESERKYTRPPSRRVYPQTDRSSDRGWKQGPIRTYEWEEHYSADTVEELDAMIEKAIDDALQRWRSESRSSKSGWKKIRSYRDPESGAMIEEYIRETESINVE